MRTLFTGAQRLFLSLLLLSVTAQATAARQGSPKFDWREFTSEPGRFTVKFPGEPRFRQRRLTQTADAVEVNGYNVAVGKDYVFGVEYLDSPGDYGNSDSAFEGGVSVMINTMVARGGRMLSKENVVRGTCEGREASATGPLSPGRTGFVQALVFNSGRRYYLLVLVALEDSPAARDAGRVFADSFVIKDGCPRPAAPAPTPTAEPVRRTVEGTPDAATGWRRVESAEHGFGVLMPGPANLLSMTAFEGNLTTMRHEYVHKNAEAVYTVEVRGDYLENFLSGLNPHETMMDVDIHGVKKHLASFGLTFGEPRKFSAGPYHAREYLMTNEQTGLRGRVRLYASPRRSYIFVGLTRGRAATAAEADLERFFSSIKLSPQ